MKYAIVESGGKQYKAVEGGLLEVDRLPVEAGKKIDLENVLLLVDGDDVTVGTPTVSGAKVSATVVEHFKGPKIIVFKYRPRERYRVKTGHRQQYTRLRVEAITRAAKKAKSSTGKASAARAAKKAEAKGKASAKSAEAKKTAKKSTAKSTKATASSAKKSAGKSSSKSSSSKTTKKS
ncbi:MAG: 50S ribosomal protein L21 [Anaerolineae bacterium]|nr:MAG: 50S ribosomal protein L21 [Anaerolineae bacterium]